MVLVEEPDLPQTYAGNYSGSLSSCHEDTRIIQANASEVIDVTITILSRLNPCIYTQTTLG